MFHTHYSGDVILDMQARAGAKVNGSDEVLVVKNDTPMHKVGLDSSEEKKFDGMVACIEKDCMKCGDFLNELVTNTGTTGDQKWHIASYLKQFFNAEIKAARSISNVDAALEGLYNFYYDKTKAMLAKLKTSNTKVAKASLVHSSLGYLENNKLKFKSMLHLYKELQETKQFIIDKLDKLETFRTFVKTENLSLIHI